MEHLISFETAKLAKEIGVNTETKRWYLKNGIPAFGFEKMKDGFPALTLEELAKWISEKEGNSIVYDVLDRALRDYLVSV